MVTTLSFISHDNNDYNKKMTSCTFQAHPTQMTRPCDARGVTFLSETKLDTRQKGGGTKGIRSTFMSQLKSNA